MCSLHVGGMWENVGFRHKLLPMNVEIHGLVSEIRMAGYHRIKQIIWQAYVVLVSILNQE